MKLKFQLKEIYKYGYLILAFIATFWLISFFEVFQLTSKNVGISIGSSLFFKLLNDFWTGLFISVFLFPLYFLVAYFHKKAAVILIQILFVIIIIGQFALVNYSLTTLINLGADLLGYSYSDITTTVSSSVEFSIGYFVPYLIFGGIFFGFIVAFKKFFPEKSLIAIYTITIVLFGAGKLVFSQTSETEYQNKLNYLVFDILKFQQEKRELNAMDLDSRTDFPFLSPTSKSENVLGPLLNLKEEKPTIVFIIVEGLGAEFVGDNTYGGFTPFLDSLIDESLYWENFVSTTGRTFGVLPSILGSLPFAEQGFLEQQKLPSHLSLISVLKANGYTTSFYSGDKSSFDRKINFLEFNGIDEVIDEDKFGENFTKTEANEGGFSWGYPDEEIFRKTISVLDSKADPRLDIIMTISNHEPFNFPNKNSYISKVDSIISTKNINADLSAEIKSYSEIFASLLYTDASIKGFITEYKKRPDFENTIFIITGDHRLIPIVQKDKLCRFHVPFYIYSPLVKQPKKFKSISSHFDVTPSVLSLLMNSYNFIKLENVPWISKGLDTAQQFRNIHKIPLMRYKGSINDYIYENYLYSDGNLFKINENFGTVKVVEHDLLNTISDSLKAFKKLNAYSTLKNKIYPEENNIYINPGIDFTQEELKIIEVSTKGLTFDKIFLLARESAFNKDFKKAQLLCNYILNEYPNHADARTLKGRTLAWEGKYKESELELLNVIKRVPYYYDCYLALMDVYWWSDQDEKSIEIAQKAFKNKIVNGDLSFKLAKAYQRLDYKKESNILMDSLLKIYPENVEYKEFKQTLK
ncbi:sulfatase-like hydrolase/transferase [Lutibacter sp.]|uniref:sulfatase-like hydrolase/transferase n=1 Tax=Lutibacter sp. TaxID=1925666 RepID=UPI001A26FEFC|nr:sulfatase-like hydrolase/transferase [Lutibacter sp.]MBI9040018.1 sulfatase-like hydrolase/transferase [Lutibacter sp.]